MLRSLLIVITTAAAARAADPPPELALVPADAAAVAHVRLADLWRHPGMADYRSLVQKAGADAVAKLDAQFVPPPSTIDRLTAVLLPPAGNGPPQILLVARFTRPFDAAAVRAAYMPGAQAQSAGGKEYYADPKGEVAVHFPDAQTLVAADPKTLAAYLGRKPAAGGKLAGFLAAAAGKPLVLAVNLKAVPLPPDAVKQLPPDFRPLLDAELATLTLSLDAGPTVAARLLYATPDEATAAEVALKKGLKQLKPLLAQGRAQMEKELGGQPGGGKRALGDLPMAAGGLVGLGLLNTLEELLDNPPLKKDGDALAAEVTLPGGAAGTTAVVAIGVGLALPAVQKVRESAARAQSSNNLKQIALALHNYHDANGSFPPAAITDKKTGKPLLSWRVAILPYLEQKALYGKFKLDEPWDSPTNLPLSKVMVKVYTDPRANDPADPGLTFYKGLVGGGAAWDWATGRKLQKITDGTSNTLLVAAFGPPVVWTQPADQPFDPKGPLPNLFTPPFSGLLAAFCDGSVRLISPTIDPKHLRAIITADGGELVGPIP